MIFTWYHLDVRVVEHHFGIVAAPCSLRHGPTARANSVAWGGLPLQRKKDDLGFTLKRRRPFFERGNGKCKKVCVESDTQTSSCPLVPNRSKGEGRLGPVERLQQQARVVLSKDKGTTDKR